MKKLLLIAFILFHTIIFGQEKAKEQKIRKNIIKTDLKEFCISNRYGLNVSWEHLMFERTSLTLDLSYLKRNYIFEVFDRHTIFEISYKFYFNKHINQMKGLYLGPSTQLTWNHIIKKPNVSVYGKYDTFNFNLGLKAGYQWLIKKKFVIDFYTAIQVLPFEKKIEIPSCINTGLKIGYKF